MKKQNRFICFFLAYCLLMPHLVVQAESKALAINGKGAILMEAKTGEVIYELDADEELSIASVTKIMTIFLIYEAIDQGKINMDDIVTVSDRAAGMGGSQIFLEAGEKQTVRDLLKSIVIASANDASVALGEEVSGSVEAFVHLMNERGAELGMKHSHFINNCGLDDEGHYSSARDVAIMTRALISQYPQVFEYSQTWQDSITHVTKRGAEEFGLTNTNKLIKWYDGATGLKTGSTSQALYCLSATAHRNDMDLIAVVLGVSHPTERFKDAMKMLDFGYANFKTAYGEAAGTVVGDIAVEKGEFPTALVEMEREVPALLPKANTEKLHMEIELMDSIEAPASQGMVVGEAIYYHADKEMGRSDLILGADVHKAKLVQQMERVIDLWFQ